jgi:hypothetical protein
MKHRKVRIVWSVMWGGVAAVLLIALWARSYWWLDQCYAQVGRLYCGVESLRGRAYSHIIFLEEGKAGQTGFFTRTATNYQVSDLELSTLQMLFRFKLSFGKWGYSGNAPTWLPVLILIGTAFAPWFRWHFRLRTLLIATTLVAVGLGLAVWLAN